MLTHPRSTALHAVLMLTAAGALASLQPAAAQPPQPYPPYSGGQQQYILVTQPQAPQRLVQGFIDAGYSDTIGNTKNDLQGGYTVGGGILATIAPGSPLDLRLDFNYTHNNFTQAFLAANVPSSADNAWGHSDMYDATLDLQFNLGRPGGFNPYVFGGGGAYNTNFYFHTLTYSGCNSYGYCSYATGSHYTDSLTKFGWNAGAGLEFPTFPGGPKFYVEGRYTRVLQGYGQSPLKFVPITVGVRF